MLNCQGGHAWEADEEEAAGGKLAAKNAACGAKSAIARVNASEHDAPAS
jgi:hypothetical protein